MTLLGRRHPDPSGGAAAERDDFGALSAVFRSRLRSERVHFAALSAALAEAEETPRAVFDDMSFRAHRLKGTAAVFEFTLISEAAAALEKAAAAAANNRADHTDAAVWSALIALVNVLGAFEDPAADEVAASA